MLTTKKWRYWVALCALPVLLATGCFGGDKKDNKGASSTAESKVLAKVNTMFGEITINKPKTGSLRVVALGWGDAEAALAVGVKPVAVLDWLGFGEASKGVGPWAVDLFGGDKPTVITDTQNLNYEQIQALSPDVILSVNGANDEKAYERLKKIAPTVYAPKDTKPWLIDWKTQQKQVAAALGVADKANEVIKKAEQSIAAGKTDAFTGLNAAVLAKGADNYGAYLPGDRRWDLVAALGFTLEPKVKELEAQGFYASVPTDKMAAVDTQVLVAMGLFANVTDEVLKQDPLISALEVTKAGRTVYVNPQVAQAFSIGTALSLPYVVKELKPLLEEAAKKAN